MKNELKEGYRHGDNQTTNKDMEYSWHIAKCQCTFFAILFWEEEKKHDITFVDYYRKKSWGKSCKWRRVIHHPVN